MKKIVDSAVWFTLTGLSFAVLWTGIQAILAVLGGGSLEAVLMTSFFSFLPLGGLCGLVIGVLVGVMEVLSDGQRNNTNNF